MQTSDLPTVERARGTIERGIAAADAAAEQDAERDERDAARYADGIATAAAVGAAMRAYRVTGTDAIKATPHHNEVALSILETPAGLTFMFHRKLGHWSSHGVRMVDLERVHQVDGLAYKVAGETFLPKPSPRPTSHVQVTQTEPVHLVLEHGRAHSVSAYRARRIVTALGSLFGHTAPPEPEPDDEPDDDDPTSAPTSPSGARARYRGVGATVDAAARARRLRRTMAALTAYADRA